MLNKEELLKDVEEKYIPMLKEVNIPDFYKCIAQFSGLHINDVNDNVMEKYLLTWAKNKFRFYEILGNKLKIDIDIEYEDESEETTTKIRALEKDYPAFALWLEEFRHIENNKIRERETSWNIRDTIERLFPNCRLEGCSLTHLFKSFLNAPDELVTKIGRVWENQTIKGKYTISIDPVDMMLASENPYDWVSCYRLELNNESSHADGCLAAILDNSSLITYVWTSEGKFSLYNKYSFKNIRYYRMRKWISISPSGNAIHFNATYPGKSYSKEFEKLLRTTVENIINKETIWQHNENYDTDCTRAYVYGYSEFSYYDIYKVKDSKAEQWEVYNEKILCPCGCGNYLVGSHDAENEDGDVYQYDGSGFLAENFYIEELEEEWCDMADDYCHNGQDCDNCIYWNRCHAVCELDHDIECINGDDAENNGNFNPDEDNIVHCGEHCEECKFYKEHCKEKNNDKEKKTNLDKLITNMTNETLNETLNKIGETIKLKTPNLLSTGVLINGDAIQDTLDRFYGEHSINTLYEPHIQKSWYLNGIYPDEKFLL